MYRQSPLSSDGADGPQTTLHYYILSEGPLNLLLISICVLAPVVLRRFPSAAPSYQVPTHRFLAAGHSAPSVVGVSTTSALLPVACPSAL